MKSARVGSTRAPKGQVIGCGARTRTWIRRVKVSGLAVSRPRSVSDTDNPASNSMVQRRALPNMHPHRTIVVITDILPSR